VSYKFLPISINAASYESNPLESRQRHPFNDKRLCCTYSLLKEQISKGQSNCIHRISDSASEAIRFYRFYSNKKVLVPEVIKMSCQVKTDLSNVEVLCVSDSTSFNLSKREYRIKDFEHLGVLNDGKTKGFHAHASLALNASNGNILGLTDVVYWHRKGQHYKRKALPKLERESQKWYLGASNSNEVLSGAKRITYLFDREADDFELFQHIQCKLGNEFIVRTQHKHRKVKYEGIQRSVTESLSLCDSVTTYEVELSDLDHYSSTSGKRIKRTARTAQLELGYMKLEVPNPDKKTDKPLVLTVIEAKETTPQLPKDEKPLHWILWTNRDINTPADAMQCIDYYLLRWTIEQLFRVMKTKGFRQESTQLETVDGILKQTTMTFEAAAKVMQLVHARNQKNAPEVDCLFDKQEQVVLQKVNERLQRKTQKQKNPFATNKLSWAAWIIARLGGWKGYQSSKPPGPTTMKTGLDKFYGIFEGYKLFNTS